MLLVDWLVRLSFPQWTIFFIIRGARICKPGYLKAYKTFSKFPEPVKSTLLSCTGFNLESVHVDSEIRTGEL